MDEYLDDLAKRIYSAFLSKQLGIGLEYTYKRYAKPKTFPPDGLWYRLAKAAVEGSNEIAEKVAAPKHRGYGGYRQ